MERLTNTHHFVWERHAYAGKPYNALRQALKAEVNIIWHKDLHANLDPPIKPSRPLTYNILNHLEEHAYSQPLDNAFSAIDYLVKVGNPETIPIAENLALQMSYLIRGYDG